MLVDRNRNSEKQTGRFSMGAERPRSLQVEGSPSSLAPARAVIPWERSAPMSVERNRNAEKQTGRFSSLDD